MTRTVNAALILGAVAASSLSGTPAGYKITLTDSATPPVLSVTAPLDSTTASISAVPAGTYTVAVVVVDGAGNALNEPVTDPTPLVVQDLATVTVNVPTAISATVV